MPTRLRAASRSSRTSPTLDGQARCWCGSTSTSRCTSASGAGPRWPTTSASAPRCRRCDWLLDRGRRRSRPARTSGGPTGTPDPRWDVAPVRERLAALCPGVELHENLRFDPGEKANDPAFVDRLVDGLRRLRQRRLRRRRTGPTPRSSARRSSLPERGRAALRQGGRGARAASSSARPGPSWPSSAGPRWPTSSACCRSSLTRSTRWSSAAAWPSPSWPPRATTSAARCSTQTHLDDCRALLDSGDRHPAADRHRGPRARRRPSGRRRGTGRGGASR